MDGFAVAAGDAGLPEGTALPVVGESLAGRPFGRDLRAGEAIRIMTGAVVPTGADAVVPVERSSGYEGEQVTFSARVEVGANIRRIGSERGAGVEVLAAGRRLDAAAIGALAVLGRHEVEVRTRPAVAIVATVYTARSTDDVSSVSTMKSKKHPLTAAAADEASTA